jgi:Cu(I)/Ag(I) efflux system membrane fusion protein
MNAKILPLFLVVALAGGVAGYFVAGKTREKDGEVGVRAERTVAFYQSPMHPWIKSDKPGKCTICGMDLVPVYVGEQGAEAGGNVVTLSEASAAVVGVKTSEVTRGTWVKTLRVTGVLDDDETKHRVVSAHIPGRIEKIFVNQIGAHVEAGQPLALLYSPEVLTAQRQYVERVRAGANAFTASERADARERLLALGLLAEEIEALESGKAEAAATVKVHAHAGGTIITRDAYEGQYVETHDKVFEVGDFSALWFVFDAYEADLGVLKVGQAVEISTAGGAVVSAAIAFIDPNVNEATRTARVRVVVDNADGRFLHRQTATGKVRVEAADMLLVPRAAVLHTRERPVVFVDKTGGGYEPRTVMLGRAGDDFYEVVGGVKAGERVVTEGALLLDGQAQLSHSEATSEGVEVKAVAKASETANAHEGHVVTTDAAMPKDVLEPLALAAADVSAALAADDFAATQKAMSALREALKKAGSAPADVKETSAKLVDGPDLKAVRTGFEPFSTAVADAAKAGHLHHRGVVKIFQCPMTPVLGTGRWLQRDDDLKNPFFGAAMLTCGEAVE